MIMANLLNALTSEKFRKTFGPGMLMAGAAIGVSHLVQATRAGADYGFSLWWVLVLACVTKYPFLEFGSRYAAATGENLLDGYRKMGKGAFPVFGILTVLTMFIILASVSLVTAGLAEQLFHLNLSMWLWCLIIMAVCISLILIGRFPALDKTMKLIVAVLTLLTFVAVAMTLGSGAPTQALSITPPSYLTSSGIAFIIAFMGWMPIPLDSSVWQSIWAREKFKQTGYQPNVKEALLDFNFGYYVAAFIGILFFLLGIFIMFGRGISFPAGSVSFSSTLVDMYGQTLGAWSRPIISVAAFVAMFSTTLAVVDIYPRVMMELGVTYNRYNRKSFIKPSIKKKIYLIFLFLIPVVALIILAYLKGTFTRLIDFAAALSFLSAPIIGWFNLKLITSPLMPEASRPKQWYVRLSWVFIAFLVLFSMVYLYWTYVK
jgi:Mn2+/Fe2+ NRAMP family transporter